MLPPWCEPRCIGQLASDAWCSGHHRPADPSTLAGAREQLVALQQAGELQRAGINRGNGRRVDDDQRRDLLTWIDAASTSGPLAALVDDFEQLRLTLNRELFAGVRRFELQAACYPGNGSFYRRHLDAFAGSSERVVTAILYLNPGWLPEHGGQLRLWAPDGSTHEITPELGNWVVFLSQQIPHEVLASFATRWALTAWFRTDS